MKQLLFLWSYVAESRASFFAALGLLMIISATSLAYPWLLKLLVDQLHDQAAAPMSSSLLAALLLVLICVATIVGYRQQLIMQSVGFSLRNALRLDFYRKLLVQPMAFHREQLMGELSARLAEDIGRVQSLPSGLVAPLFQNTLFLLGCVTLMALLNAAATLILLPLLLLPIPVILLTSRSIRASSSKSQSIHARAGAFFEETLVGIREVKVFAGEERALERYRLILSEAQEAELSASKQHVLVNQSVYFLLSFLLLAIFYAGSAQSFFREWSLGGVIAFYFYAYTLSMALISQTRLFISHQSIFGAIDRVIEILAKAEPPDQRRDGHEAALRGALEFDSVSFAYESERPVLSDLTFAATSSSWCVVTGPSGSGKSTLAGLILGLDRPSAGRILLDGISMEMWSPGALRRQIGFVGQEPILFHGSIRDNIAFSCPDLPEAKLVDLVRQSSLDAFIASLPKGLDTIIGERGYALSGGQRARIALARALALEPALLVLDEVGAMLEPELEDQIWERLAEVRGKRATIILTHHAERIPPHLVQARVSLQSPKP